MDWQTTLAWIAVTCAAAYIAWRAYRMVRPGKAGCAGGCGCAKAQTTEKPGHAVLIPSEQLVLRPKTAGPTD